MWIKNKEPVIQNGRHMYRPELTQALPVSPVYSISVPPTHRRERPRLNQQPAFGMTVQSQQLDSGQKTMPGLLPGAFGGLWRELGPFFTSTQWKLSLQRSAQMELCEADSCLNSLSVTALGLVTTLFSQLCTRFESCSTSWHDWLQLKAFFFNPLHGVVFIHYFK